MKQHQDETTTPPDDLLEASKDAAVELTENDLSRVSGGYAVRVFKLKINNPELDSGGNRLT